MVGYHGFLFWKGYELRNTPDDPEFDRLTHLHSSNFSSANDESQRCMLYNHTMDFTTYSARTPNSGLQP